MPHYRDGSVAKEGDLVFCDPVGQKIRTLGIIVQITPGSTSCNAQLMPFARFYLDGAWRGVSSPYSDCVMLGECSLAIAAAPHEIPPEPENAAMVG